MEGIALIAICLLIGMLLPRLETLPDNFTNSLNIFAIRVSLPALVFKHLHALPAQPDMLAPALAPWAAFLLTACLAWTAGRFFRLPAETVGCLILVCGVGNTSIVGVPIVQTFLGQNAVGYALLADQSNFIVMCTLSMLTVSVYSTGDRLGLSTLRRILAYRPVQAMLLALALRPFVFPAWLEQALTTVGATLTPLAIISIGASLAFRNQGERMKHFLIGASLKLVLIPAAIYAILAASMERSSVVFQASVLQSAMPPMIMAGMIAIDRKLDATLATMLIGLGIPLSFVTTFCWSLALR